MLPALSELKRIILDHSADNWNSVENVRTITRTLKSILKIAEWRAVQGMRRKGSHNSSIESSLDNSCNNMSRVSSDHSQDLFNSDEERVAEEENESSEESDNDDGMSFKTANDKFEDEYDADNELLCAMTDSEKELSVLSVKFNDKQETRKKVDVDSQFVLNDCVLQVIMEILFELSKKCVAQPTLWASNIISVISRMNLIKYALGGNEVIIKGFALVLQCSDSRLLELQKSILELVTNIDSPNAVSAFLNLFTSEKPPVELLLQRFHHMTITNIKVEPTFKLEFPTLLDGSAKIFCDQMMARSVSILREYHNNFRLETAFTRSSIIAPLNPINFKPWTKQGFTISTWLQINEMIGFDPASNSTSTSNGIDRNIDEMYDKSHIVSIGSNKLLLSIYVDGNGTIFVQLIRPNTPITKDTRHQPSSSTPTLKKSVSFASILKKTLKLVDNPEFFVTKKMLPFDHKLPKGKWLNLVFSVLVEPDKIIVKMTVNGSQQFVIEIWYSNVLNSVRNSNISVLCIGETFRDENDKRVKYCLSNVLLFKQYIPEEYKLLPLVMFGPDFYNCRSFQTGNLVPNYGLIDPQMLFVRRVGFCFEKSMKLIQNNIILAFTAKKPTCFLTSNNLDDISTLGFVVHGKVPRSLKVVSFCSSIVTTGGLEILLYLFAKTVELEDSSFLQSLSLNALLVAAHKNIYLYTEFVENDFLIAINSVLKTTKCKKDIYMLQTFLNIAFDAPVLKILQNGRVHKITTNDVNLIYPELILSIINNYHVWCSDNSETDYAILEILFEVLISLNSRSLKELTTPQLIYCDLVGSLINFSKIHLSGMLYQTTFKKSLAQKLVDLFSIYGKTPPLPGFLDEIAKLLLLIHEPSCVFVTQDRINFYYSLSGSQPHKIKQISKTAERFSKSLKLFEKKRKAVFRRRSPNSDRMWRPRNSLYDNYPKEQIIEDAKDNKLRPANILKDIVKITKMKNLPVSCKARIHTKDVAKLAKSVHNHQVIKRRRDIKRNQPLYLRIGIHAKKKEFSSKVDHIWIKSLDRNLSTSTSVSGAESIQIELIKHLQKSVILLADNTLNTVLEHYLTIDLIMILANNPNSQVRTEIINLLSIICDRLPIEKLNTYLKNFTFHHIANQLIIHPIQLDVADACKKWLMGGAETLKDHKLTHQSLSAAGIIKQKMGLIFLFAILPQLVDHYECSLISCIQLIGNLVEMHPDIVSFMFEQSFIIPSLVKCWTKLYSKRTFMSHAERPGSVLMFFTYYLSKKAFLSTAQSGNYYHCVWDLLHSLNYVANTSLSVAVRRGMRIVQAKILDGLLKQCVQKFNPFHKYLWGIRRVQSKSVIYLKNSFISVPEMKTKFTQLFEFSVLFIQSKDSQYEPKTAEMNLVRTIIQLGLVARIKIGSILTWSLAPFRDTELKLFAIKCLAHLMKSKHVLTYGINISMVRVFTKKILSEVKEGAEFVAPERVKMVVDFAKFLNTDSHTDMWAILKSMSKIDEISCDIKEDQMREIERAIHRHEAVAVSCISTSNKLTREFVEAQNTDRRDIINQMRTEKIVTFDWKSLNQRMIHENAPYYNSRYFPNSWEIDDTEGPSRVRLRMKRCYLQIKPSFLLPENQELQKQLSPVPPLYYLLNSNTNKSRNSITDQVLYNFAASQIKGDLEITGEMVITEPVITFFPDDDDKEPIIIEISNIIDIWLRRFMHQDKGVEIFLISAHTILFVMHDMNDRKLFEKYFCDKIFDPSSCKWHTFVMQQWRDGNLTNWEYLTALNQLSGRSFQDLMQYPVFPWILSDYESSVLDLNNSNAYRILEKPIAVQHEECKEYYESGYELLRINFVQSVSHFPYHYACHYSNSGTVLSFLIRVQPFTKMFVKYQDNHFDLPDRTFFSINHAWKLASKDSTTDVKELVPEFFSFPEMFENNERYDFGVCQGGERVHHVNLPSWSHCSARMFVFIHRQALESDFVRNNIKDWIDLIFGYKQVGQDAIKATNVFHSATYPAYAHALSDDPLDKLAYETMIRTYGQMPKQLLTQPHPQSLVQSNPVLDSSPLSANYSVKGLRWGKFTGSPELKAPNKIQSYANLNSNVKRVVFLDSTNTIYAIPDCANYMQGIEVDTINCITWNHPDNIVRINRVSADKTLKPLFENTIHDDITCCGTHVFSNQLWFGYESGRIVVHQCIDFIPERLNKIRYLQNSYLANTMSYNSAFRIFKSSGSSFSRKFSDSSVKQLHDIGKLNWKQPITLICHTEKIVNIKICTEFKIAVSIGWDGRAAIWDTNTLEYVRQIEPPIVVPRLPIALLAISPTLGDIITIHKKDSDMFDVPESTFNDTEDESYEVTESNMDDFVKVSMNLNGKTLMRLHTINAKYVNHVTISEKILSVCYSNVKEGTGINVVATGFENGIVKLWSSWDLSFILEINTKMGDIIDLCFSTYQHLVVLTKDNCLQVWESDGLPGNPPKFPQIDFKS